MWVYILSLIFLKEVLDLRKVLSLVVCTFLARATTLPFFFASQCMACTSAFRRHCRCVQSGSLVLALFPVWVGVLLHSQHVRSPFFPLENCSRPPQRRQSVSESAHVGMGLVVQVSLEWH